MERDEFATRLARGPLVADGGTGTALIDLGFDPTEGLERANDAAPEVVASVHRSFVEAGAGMVFTNTFGANTFSLARHGLAARGHDLIARGVTAARGAAGSALVAGSVGPLGVRIAPLGRVSEAQALEAFAEQIGTLVEAGVDLVVIETQVDVREAELGVEAARSVAAPVPVVVAVTFTADDRTVLGTTPEEVAIRLAASGADAIGVNCGEGPAQALRVLRAFAAAAGGVPILAKPNAGRPSRVGGRFVYPASPAYLGTWAREALAAGATILGGCCGTGPEHVRSLAAALDPVANAPTVELHDVPVAVATREEPAPPTDLQDKLAAGRFVVTVELEPPRSPSLGGVLAIAQTLAEAGADALDVTDSPLARMRMSPWAVCRLLQDELDLETVLHLQTRGRSLLRLQGDLLGAHALGLRNVFVCLGDPLTIGDYPRAADHVDVKPTGLISLMASSLNAGLDGAGTALGEPTSFFVGAALNPVAPDLAREARLLRRKVLAGAGFALTQPVFEVEPIRRIRAAYEREAGEELVLPLVVGMLPLVSARHAEFLRNEVPGIDIPDEVAGRLVRGGGEARAGLEIATELCEELSGIAAGVYVIPQLGRFDLAASLVEAAARVSAR